MKWEFICCMNFLSSIQNIIYKNLHYCRTRWIQNNKIFCIECVINLVHILRLFPQHPRGQSHWRNVFLAATAAQEAQVSLGLSVCVCVRNLVGIVSLQHCNITTLQYCKNYNIATLHHRNFATMWHYHNATLQRCSITTSQL